MIRSNLNAGTRPDSRRDAVLPDRDQATAGLCDRLRQPCQLLLRLRVKIRDKPEHVESIMR